jgi:hypothetical protein
MRYYSKVINGETVVKPANEIRIRCKGFELIHPSEPDILLDGWVLHHKDDDEYKIEIMQKKDELIRKVKEYDLSDKVRVFYKDGVPMWLDKLTRMNLRIRFELELKRGHDKTFFWYDNVPYSMSTKDALDLIDKVDEYAFRCYDTTQILIEEIMRFDNLGDLNVYDYKTKYPSILYI